MDDDDGWVATVTMVAIVFNSHIENQKFKIKYI